MDDRTNEKEKEISINDAEDIEGRIKEGRTYLPAGILEPERIPLIDSIDE